MAGRGFLRGTTAASGVGRWFRQPSGSRGEGQCSRLDVLTLQGHEGGLKMKDSARPGPRGLWVELGQERATRYQLVYFEPRATLE